MTEKEQIDLLEREIVELKAQRGDLFQILQNVSEITGIHPQIICEDPSILLTWKDRNVDALTTNVNHVLTPGSGIGTYLEFTDPVHGDLSGRLLVEMKSKLSVPILVHEMSLVLKIWKEEPAPQETH